MPSPPSYGCCTRVNFVLKKHLLFQMNLSNSGLKNRSIKEYWLIFTVLKFPLGLQFSHNLTKFKIIKYISTIYIMTTTCTYLQQLTQVSDVAHGPLVLSFKAKFVSLFSLELCKLESSDMVYIYRTSDCIVGSRLRVMALIFLFLSIFLSFPILHVIIKNLSGTFKARMLKLHIHMNNE